MDAHVLTVFPLDLDDYKIKWSRHRSFLYWCDRSPEMHILKLGVDTSFYPGYYGSSSPKKKLIAERRKVAQDYFQGGRFLPFNFGPSFDLLNVIIWTAPLAGKLFKIKFSSQVPWIVQFTWTDRKLRTKEWNKVETTNVGGCT